ncbi:MAG: hypothetical protein AB7C90_00360 [Bacteroidales bacterium]
MSRHLFPIVLLLIALVSCGKQKVVTQSPQAAATPVVTREPNNDVVIERMKAMNLADSLNAHLPDSVRVAVIRYLSEQQMNPAEYYTLYPSQVLNGRRGIGLCRIEALRELDYYKRKPKAANGSISVKIGASGGPGDDIVVLFDEKLKTVQKIVPAE